jgi:hypothetical protein
MAQLVPLAAVAWQMAAAVAPQQATALQSAALLAAMLLLAMLLVSACQTVVKVTRQLQHQFQGAFPAITISLACTYCNQY